MNYDDGNAKNDSSDTKKIKTSNDDDNLNEEPSNMNIVKSRSSNRNCKKWRLVPLTESL